MEATRQDLVTALQNADKLCTSGDQTACNDARQLANLLQTGQYKGGRDVTKQLEMEVESQAGDEKLTPESLEPGFLETELGQTTGGIAGGIAGAKKGYQMGGPTPMGKAVGTFAGGAFGAFGGGFVGEGAQQTYLQLTDNPLAEQNYEDTINKMFQSGTEEAIYDVTGQVLFRGLGKTWEFVRGKPVEGIEEVDKILKEFGGQITPAQAADSGIIDYLESFVRASWSADKLKEIDAINETALTNYIKEYVKQFANTGTDQLTSMGVGRMFINTIEDGQKLHSKASNDMFGKLDEFYQNDVVTKTITKKVPTNILGPDAKMLNASKTATVEVANKPVSTQSIKNLAQSKLKLIEGELKGAASGDEANRLLKSIMQMDEGLSFAAANEFRSNLLSKLRSLSIKAEGTKTSSLFRQLEAEISQSMEKAAEKSGNENFIKQWREANKFYRQGKERLNNDFITQLLGKEGTPEQIGKTVFHNGNISQIKKTRDAVLKAVQLSKKANKKDPSVKVLKFDEIWGGMQKGYFNDIISKSFKEGEGFSIPKLKAYFNEGIDQGKTFKTAFTSKQRDSIKSFINTIDRIQRQPLSKGQFLVTIGTASLVLTGFGVTTGEFPAKEIGTFVLTPALLSRLLLSPRTAKLLTKGLVTKPYGTQAGAIFTKLMAEVQKAQYQDKDILGNIQPMQSE